MCSKYITHLLTASLGSGIVLILAACTTQASCPPTTSDPLPEREAPYRTPAEVLSHFCQLEQAFVNRRDERGPHITSYVVATHAVMQHLDCGYFMDDDWVRRAIVHYGNRFRQSLSDYESGNRHAVPCIWLIAHDVPRSKRATLHQSLLLGIVAHIRDLTYTLAHVGVQPVTVRMHDYYAVNSILQQAVDRMQSRLCCTYSAGFGLTDFLGGELDESLGTSWVVAMRKKGWSQGVRLARSNSPAARLAATHAIEETAYRRAYRILAIPKWLRALESQRSHWQLPLR